MPNHHPPHKTQACYLRRRRMNRQRGFTLIEVLLAGLILAVFGAAMAGMINTGLTQMARAEDFREAARWLDEVLVRVDVIGPAILSEEGPTSGQLDGKYGWAVQIDPLLDGSLYQVTATVSWQRGQRERSVSAYTLINDAPGSRLGTIGWEGFE